MSELAEQAIVPVDLRQPLGNNLMAGSRESFLKSMEQENTIDQAFVCIKQK